MVLLMVGVSYCASSFRSTAMNPPFYEMWRQPDRNGRGSIYSMTMRYCVGLLIAISIFPANAAKRGVTAEDYFAFESISDPHISPDGKQVAYVLTTVDAKRNRRDNSVWMVAADGHSAPRRLSAEGLNSTAPRWSPDGASLAFVSTRGAGAADAAEAPRPQICLLPMNGGEAMTLTHLKNGAGAYEWSPDGSRLAVVSRTGASDNVPASARKSDVRHYTHISYK